MNNRTIFINSVEQDTDVIVLIPNREIKNLVNVENYRLIIACNVTSPTANLPIVIQTELGQIPVLCKYGNNILANQLNKRIAYCVGYGSENENYENGQFVLFNINMLNKRGQETQIEPSL